MTSDRPLTGWRRRLSVANGAAAAGGMCLFLAAVVRELRIDRAERTWQGRLAGIPYDLRLPTPSRLRAAYWAPDDPRLFPPRPAGVGWAVNVGRLARRR